MIIVIKLMAVLAMLFLFSWIFTALLFIVGAAMGSWEMVAAALIVVVYIQYRDRISRKEKQ